MIGKAILQRLLRTAPPHKGIFAGGSLEEILQCGRAVVLVIDDRGRIFQMHDATVDGARLQPIGRPRTAINALLDRFDVRDGPTWSDIDGEN